MASVLTLWHLPFLTALSSVCSDPAISAAQHLRRLTLEKVMRQAGFANYANEWWHYTLANEPFPYTFFNFTVA